MLTSYQLLIALTFLAYFNVLADLFTQKMRRLADTGDVLANVRDRLRALLVRWGNNSVSPVEEINLNGNPGNTQYSTVADNDQNGLTEHIR